MIGSILSAIGQIKSDVAQHLEPALIRQLCCELVHHCQRAFIPDVIVYRSKWRLAVELLDRAQANGVTFAL
jgi:hypothetical protein